MQAIWRQFKSIGPAQGFSIDEEPLKRRARFVFRLTLQILGTRHEHTAVDDHRATCEQ
jgi:hypothetical protein